MEKGRSEGLSEGRREGRLEGQRIGHNAGLEKGVKALIETCKELGLTYEETLSKLILRFDYDNRKAGKAMDKYWR